MGYLIWGTLYGVPYMRYGIQFTEMLMRWGWGVLFFVDVLLLLALLLDRCSKLLHVFLKVRQLLLHVMMIN